MIFRHSFFKYHYGSICWALLILLLSGLPGNGFPDLSFWHFLTFDKFAHALFYGAFVVLLTIGEIKHRRFSASRSNALWISFTIGLTYSIVIEILQAVWFVNRFADFGDIVANTIGCTIGVVYFKYNFSECLRPVRW